MIGRGMASGLAVTLKHFVRSSRQVLQRPRAGSPDVHQTALNSEDGVFTVQYPEQRLAPPERFRYLPMLITDTATGKSKCTSCGICAKVCPPQAIWIVRARGADGKPAPKPEQFVIEGGVCMGCGLCAEYCAFDSIKISHDHELSTDDAPSLVLTLERLLVPEGHEGHQAQLQPTGLAKEQTANRRRRAT